MNELIVMQNIALILFIIYAAAVIFASNYYEKHTEKKSDVSWVWSSIWLCGAFLIELNL